MYDEGNFSKINAQGFKTKYAKFQDKMYGLAIQAMIRQYFCMDPYLNQFSCITLVLIDIYKLS